jgi:uncharacterized protein (DUF1800 family)
MNNNLPLAAALVDAHKQARSITSTTVAYTGQWTRTEAVHLLKRTMFGAAKADVDHMLTLTVSQAVDELINTVTTAPSPPLNNYGTAAIPDPNIAFGATWVNDTANGTTVMSSRIISLISWWISNMLSQGRSLEQKMTLFWHNHLSTQILVYNDGRAGYKHLETLRTNSMGNFQTLIKAISIDPAMLFYLNGYLNTSAAPDENYGRELQELFTQGKGPNSLYTEDDVKAAARVMTGFQVSPTTVTSSFNPSLHDTNPKQFSAYYNNTVISNSGNGGASELDDMITMLLATNECAEYICRCLYRYFVYYSIDSTIEANVIAPMAALLRTSYDIKPVLSLLFKSEHFLDPLNMGCFIKPPVDYHVGMMRQLGVVFPNSTDLATQYYMWAFVSGLAANAGQQILNPPNVAGWPAYYQVPEFHELWINSSSLPLRQEIADGLIYTGLTYNGQTLIFGPLSFTASMPTPSDPVALTTDVLSYLLSIPVSATVQNYLIAILLSGQSNNSYWTSAWSAYQASPTTLSLQTTVLNRLKPFYQYIMDLPEYQLQ